MTPQKAVNSGGIPDFSPTPPIPDVVEQARKQHAQMLEETRKQQERMFRELAIGIGAVMIYVSKGRAVNDAPTVDDLLVCARSARDLVEATWKVE